VVEGYGFARATMGHLPGVVVGMTETLEYVLSVAGGAYDIWYHVHASI